LMYKIFALRIPAPLLGRDERKEQYRITTG
jgi:hypothetical protein